MISPAGPKVQVNLTTWVDEEIICIICVVVVVVTKHLDV
jgi:hypothetical protein